MFVALRKVKRMAGAIYKALAEKYLLEEYKGLVETQEKKKKLKTVAAKPVEVVAYRVAEVREMYDNPGPYAKLLERAPTFEEHLQQIYFSQGFACEQRDGAEWLVKQ